MVGVVEPGGVYPFQALSDAKTTGEKTTSVHTTRNEWTTIMKMHTGTSVAGRSKCKRLLTLERVEPQHPELGEARQVACADRQLSCIHSHTLRK